MNEVLCLTWKNHCNEILSKFHSLQNEELFADATIVCQNKFYPVHKLLLSSCSDYFKEIFKATPCHHPFLIMNEIDHEHLEALLNYMYKGETSISQDSLSSLIKVAETLKIMGLASTTEQPYHEQHDIESSAIFTDANGNQSYINDKHQKEADTLKDPAIRLQSKSLKESYHSQRRKRPRLEKHDSSYFDDSPREADDAATSLKQNEMDMRNEKMKMECSNMKQEPQELVLDIAKGDSYTAHEGCEEPSSEWCNMLLPSYSNNSFEQVPAIVHQSKPTDSASEMQIQDSHENEGFGKRTEMSNILQSEGIMTLDPSLTYQVDVSLPKFSESALQYLEGVSSTPEWIKNARDAVINELLDHLDKNNLISSNIKAIQRCGYAKLQQQLIDQYPNCVVERSTRKHERKKPMGDLIAKLADRRRKRKSRCKGLQISPFKSDFLPEQW